MTGPDPLPRTVVPAGITDPVESARAELKAALAAIEQKANVPRRIEKASARGAVKLRRANREHPALVVAGVAVVAATVGGLVWLGARFLAR